MNYSKTPFSIQTECKTNAFITTLTKPLIIGFDAEWVKKQAYKQTSNKILSYQFFGIFEDKTWQEIFYPLHGNRYKLSFLLSKFIQKGFKEKCLKKWPKILNLVGHWTTADLLTLRDFHTLLKQSFDIVRKSFITNGKPSIFNLYDKNRHKHSCAVKLYDSMLLAPQGKNRLADLGELHGVNKIVLEKGTIEKMDILLKTNPKLFEEYALRDAEIAAKHFNAMNDWIYEKVGKQSPNSTLSGLAESYCIKYWSEHHIDYKIFLGLEEICETKWSRKLNKAVKQKKIRKTNAREINESFATLAYYGGRNETYIYGASHEDTWIDWDLSSAYTTAMAILGMPHYENSIQTLDVEKFQPDCLGMASITFEFPPDCKFPCLPVKTPTGLIFPLKGKTICPSPEIYLAHRMGAYIKISQGLIVPMDTNLRPFQEIMKDLQKQRKTLPKGSWEELTLKEIGNSIYGKTAQGLGNKKVFDNHSGTSQPVAPSKMTNPYFASVITGLIRAALSEILYLLDPKTTVINATTDGFLSNATLPEIKKATEGPICTLLKKTKYQLLGNKEILEPKHEVRKALGFRTRGQATLQKTKGKKSILARAGLHTPKDIDPNEWIVENFENRTSETFQILTHLTSIREICLKGGDLVPQEIKRKIKMDYDWKRQPSLIETRKIKEKNHIFFETKPWICIEDYLQQREEWESFSKNCGGVLKTEEDLKNFEDYKKTSKTSKKGLRRDKKDATLKIALRQFLRAYVREEAGLKKILPYSKLVGWLKKGGYEISISDVKNSKRNSAKLVFNAVPRTEESFKFFNYVKKQFPEFDQQSLFEI